MTTLEFPDTIAAQIRGAHVRMADLVRFEFASGEKRVWSGFGDLTVDGEVWEGLGDLGQVSAVSMGPGEAVEEMTYTLFGTTKILEKFQSDAHESAGHPATHYLLFFDVRQFDEQGNWVDWLPLDHPFELFWGRMGPLIANRPRHDVGATDPRLRSVSVRVVNAFVNRRKPAHGFYSHRDQLARSLNHNDNLYVNASRMASISVRWPDF